MANKFSKLAVLSILSLLTLTACNDNEIINKPSTYEDELVINAGNEIYHNSMEAIYDAIREGSLASDVLDEVLYQYANSVFGYYNSVTKGTATATTLKEAAEGAALKNDVAKNFITDHKAYWSINSDGKRYNNDGASVKVYETDEEAKNASPSEEEYQRVIAKWQSIQDRIAKAMYNKVSGGSYSYRNIFSEKKFVDSLKKSMMHVKDTGTYYAGMILPENEDKDVFTDGILHIENYTGSEGVTYIEDEIVPSIYNELLIEQYLLDESYTTLERSYARKVNILKIEGSSEYPTAADKFIKSFIQTKVFNTAGTKTTKDDFDVWSKAWNGVIDGDTASDTILNDAGLNKTTGKGTIPYYEGTAYGALIEKYNKIVWTNEDLSDTSIESEFTNSGAYSAETGLQLKTNEIMLKNSATHGWYIKNGGLSSLPESIRNRLFNVGVANGIKEDGSAVARDNTTCAPATGESKYVAYINGNYYLKVSTKSYEDPDWKDILFQDGDNYYVIQVEEAANQSKMSKNGDNSYAKLRSDAERETIVNDVVNCIGSSDTYKSLAKKYWLEKMSIEYHDTVIFDYFKANYPELFEDD